MTSIAFDYKSVANKIVDWITYGLETIVQFLGEYIVGPTAKGIWYIISSEAFWHIVGLLFIFCVLFILTIIILGVALQVLQTVSKPFIYIFKSIMRNYFTAKISRETIEDGLMFLVTLQPDQDNPDANATFNKNLKLHRKKVAKITNQIQQFGEQIQPSTLENMQKVYSSFVESDKFKQSDRHALVAKAALESGWHGIGPWRAHPDNA